MAGKSLLDLLWAELDQFVEDFQALNAEATNWDTRNQLAELAEARGRAHAAAVCVALATNPYHLDVDAIKAEALERWENAHDVPPPPDPGQDDRRARRRARRLARQRSDNE